MDAGVSHVVLAVSYRAEQMEQELRQEAEKVSGDHRACRVVPSRTDEAGAATGGRRSVVITGPVVSYRAEQMEQELRQEAEKVSGDHRACRVVPGRADGAGAATGGREGQW